MKKILCTSILLAAGGVLAAPITGVTSGAGSNGQFSVIFKGADVLPSSFNTTTPTSIVLDFPDTSSALSNREVDVNQNGVFSVNVIPGDGRTRAVINLAGPVSYQVTRVGQDVYVSFPTATSVVATETVALAPASTNSSGLFNNYSTTAVPEGAQRVSLNAAPAMYTSPQAQQAAAMPNFSLAPMFHRNGKTGGRLSFQLPSDDTVVNVKTEGSTIVAVIENYSVPKGDEKRLDVADYGSPVRYVDIIRKGADTDVRVNMGRNGYEFVTYQNGSTYTIEVEKPDLNSLDQKAKELTGFGADRQYSGAPLSLNFQDIEVRAVLQIIAEFTNQNIVVSDSVVGNITLRLDNVPWDQALEIIMKTKSLAMRKNGGVIYVAPEAELNKSEIEALADWQKKQELMPSRTELIQVKYAKAIDLKGIIEDSQGSGGNRGASNSYMDDSILSSKGSVSVDERTNTLLVNDIPSKIQEVRDLVERLDEPVRQVLVDSRLVITSDKYARDFGARFGVSWVSGDGNIAGSGNLDGVDAERLGGKPDSADLSDRLGVNFAAAGSNPASYALSILASDVLIDLELQAQQSEGRSEIISSPRVVTQDGYKALIASGQEIPYSTTDSDGGTNTEFKDAKLSMEVTPRIAPNDRVSMDINITKDQPDYGNLVNGEPPLNTNELDTRVEVDNGETIVLGGIYEQTQSVSEDKVPLLGDIPVLGNVFKSTSKTFAKDELLIFITPRIIDSRLTEYDKFSNLRD